MKKANQLYWITQQRKVSELIISDFNPRKIEDSQKKALLDSLEKFDLVDIPVLNSENMIISGNQRVKALILAGRSDENIDCRIPSRKLSEQEEKEQHHFHQ